MSTSTFGGHVNTIPEQAAGGRRRRRNYSDDFKADLVASCMQPGMSMAAVAMGHGINAKLLRRWVREAEMGGVAQKPQPLVASKVRLPPTPGVHSAIPENAGRGA